MRFKTYYFIIPFFIFLSVSPVLAQDPSATDEYSDYSYLWEDAKSKKKKNKKKDTTPVVETVPEPADSLDVTENQQYATPKDSIDQQNTVDNYTPPSDTIPNNNVPEPLEEPIQEEEIAKEPKQPREKKDYEGVSDFRAGMSGGASASFTGGVTYTQIGSNSYVGLVLSPEFSIGKVGVGISVPILYGLDDQQIRTEIFKGGVGPLRLIRYVRYGVQKTDPIYVRVGELSGTMIGFGGLVNNYTNTTSYEKRKVGLHFDFNVKKGLAGMEGLYSDFDPSSLNLLVLRPYSRPLIWTDIPIVRTLEVGATFVKDKDQTVRNGQTYNYTKDGIGAFGLDMGMIMLSIPFIQIDLFANYSSLNITDVINPPGIQPQDPGVTNYFAKAGHGASIGTNFRFNFIADILSTDIRIERLNYSDNYLPQFFDATYELNKDAKILSLANVQKTKGIYGSLTGNILQIVQLGGSLLIPDEISVETPATVRVSADLERLANKFSMHASYIKGGLTDLGDAFTFDERSLAKVRFIYHMNKFLATGVDYYYYWEQKENGNFKATRYVMPYFGVSIQF